MVGRSNATEGNESKLVLEFGVYRKPVKEYKKRPDAVCATSRVNELSNTIQDIGW